MHITSGSHAAQETVADWIQACYLSVGIFFARNIHFASEPCGAVMKLQYCSENCAYK